MNDAPGMLTSAGYDAPQAQGGMLGKRPATAAEVRAAIMRLRVKGLPLTRDRIAEEIALGGDAPAPAAPEASGGYMGERTADPDSAEGRAEAAARAKKGSTKGLTPEQKRKFGIR